MIKTKENEKSLSKRYGCPAGGFVTAEICATCKDREDKRGNKCPALT